MAQDSWKQDKEETSCQPREGPVMCTNNCRFFGSAVTLGMCSKCYRASSAKTAENDALSQQRGAERTLSESSCLATRLLAGGTIIICSSGSMLAIGSFLSLLLYAGSQWASQLGFKCRCGNSFCSLR